MGKLYEEITDRLAEFMESSPVFFVATAPAGTDGHINVSPKGLDSFRVISPKRVAYLDMTGSGAETIAHLRENGRITIMFAAFSGQPNILRIYGRGRAVLPGTAEFEELASVFASTQDQGSVKEQDRIEEQDSESESPPARSIINVEVERIADSCGFGVPLMEYKGAREELTKWSEKKGPEGLAKYQAEKNTHSIDGLPALDG